LVFFFFFFFYKFGSVVYFELIRWRDGNEILKFLKVVKPTRRFSNY